MPDDRDISPPDPEPALVLISVLLAAYLASVPKRRGRAMIDKAEELMDTLVANASAERMTKLPGDALNREAALRADAWLRARWPLLEGVLLGK